MIHLRLYGAFRLGWCSFYFFIVWFWIYMDFSGVINFQSRWVGWRSMQLSFCCIYFHWSIRFVHGYFLESGRSTYSEIPLFYINKMPLSQLFLKLRPITASFISFLTRTLYFSGFLLMPIGLTLHDIVIYSISNIFFSLLYIRKIFCSL